MYIFINTGQNTEFFIVDTERHIVRKSTCRNCNVYNIVRMTENILVTYPEIEEVRVEGVGIGGSVVDAMEESDRINVPVVLYKIQTL